MRNKLAHLLTGAALVLAFGSTQVFAQAQPGGVKIGGNANQTTTVLGTTNTTALGLGTKACTTIGSIGENPDC